MFSIWHCVGLAHHGLLAWRDDRGDEYAVTTLALSLPGLHLLIKDAGGKKMIWIWAEQAADMVPCAAALGSAGVPASV